MHELRSYQHAAVAQCFEHFRQGIPAVLLVSPTGSGKTRMGLEVVKVALQGGKVLWLAHRKELVEQAADRLRQLGVPVGIIKAGHPYTKKASIQVASIQTLVARGLMPPARVVVIDEAHHYAAADWGKVAGQYSGSAMLGLTATPERSDKRGLGDLFQALVLAANYPDLIEAGHLCPAKLHFPKESLKGVAQDPVKAYLERGEEGSGFLFTGSIKLAEEYVERFREAGVMAGAIHAKTPPEQREGILKQLRGGRLKMVCNVQTMTEGVDVPHANVCILARSVGHVSTYLQMVGRVLRTSPGKKYGIVIDLAGNYHKHGSPVEARHFSLESGIQKEPGPGSLSVCPMCGLTYRAGPRCPGCGYTTPHKENPLRIYGADLEVVFDGPGTPDWAKRRTLERMVQTGMPAYGIKKRYTELFGEAPELAPLLRGSVRQGEYTKLMEQAKSKGYSKGWAAYRFKATFGFFPPREWENA